MPAVKRFFPAFCFSVLTATCALVGTANADDSASEFSNQDLVKVDVITSEGQFTLQLRPDVAPDTVANFLEYVRSSYYDDTVFHRVIPGFMIQGGGFTEQLQRKETRPPIRNEATGSLPNLRGTLAMARTNAPDSATAQFFVNLTDNDFLNPNSRSAGYAVFGKVVSGMGVIDAIANVQTGSRQGMNDVPLQAVTIESMSIVNSSDQ
ncbi:peptidyl-prolyl cis-trans isomerase A (cyclophilin A) [Marinobacter sp. LV10R520-4]|uniref:peptidylprolyl isomerase n=1 Tax=Marinobacter sp. LV10R520-4 TaxID=1761796 RepID=UPI000BF875B0|nr:peptidylprolyl isomerase [Marinobacter sp. LV10R520-4]PFG54229.1 peptidyl-prolyl cis-trans isomerase A (cyclophilin A) [Marinobacter sp. LV10R520-4]